MLFNMSFCKDLSPSSQGDRDKVLTAYLDMSRDVFVPAAGHLSHFQVEQNDPTYLNINSCQMLLFAMMPYFISCLRYFSDGLFQQPTRC